jgi:hypothetical protein
MAFVGGQNHGADLNHGCHQLFDPSFLSYLGSCPNESDPGVITKHLPNIYTLYTHHFQLSLSLSLWL